MIFEAEPVKTAAGRAGPLAALRTLTKGGSFQRTIWILTRILRERSAQFRESENALPLILHFY